MYAVARPHVSVARPLLADTPVGLLGAAAGAAIAAWGFAAVGVVTVPIARAVAAGSAQGALLGTAVAWTLAPDDRGRRSLPVGITVTALLGAIAAATIPFGAFAYLLAPIWLWRRRARLPALGLDGRPSAMLALAGLGLGLVLAAHLVVSASLTLGYRVGWPESAALAPWLAYDAGANVLAAECFFRGALFARAVRRWSFGAAAAISTAVCLGRYLLDPLLPRTIEMTAGAAFYVGLLSIGCCWLYWRSGSVLPGLVGGVAFFVVYRLLQHVR